MAKFNQFSNLFISPVFSFNNFIINDLKLNTTLFEISDINNPILPNNILNTNTNNYHSLNSNTSSSLKTIDNIKTSSYSYLDKNNQFYNNKNTEFYRYYSSFNELNKQKFNDLSKYYNSSLNNHISSLKESYLRNYFSTLNDNYLNNYISSLSSHSNSNLYSSLHNTNNSSKSSKSNNLSDFNTSYNSLYHYKFVKDIMKYQSQNYNNSYDYYNFSKLKSLKNIFDIVQSNPISRLIPDNKNLISYNNLDKSLDYFNHYNYKKSNSLKTYSNQNLDYINNSNLFKQFSEISNENLSVLRDYTNNINTINPQINVSLTNHNQINSDVDFEDIIEDLVLNVNEALAICAEGVHF